MKLTKDRTPTRRLTSLADTSDTSDTTDATREASASQSEAAEAKPWFRTEFHFGGKLVKPEVVMAFSRQLASFLEAGIPLHTALEIVGEETASEPMRMVIAEIAASIQRGTGFAQAAAAHQRVFPTYYLAMLVSAEYTGHLDEVLGQLADDLERDISARRTVKSAMTYPIVVLVVATIAMVVMSVFVLPKFSGLYRSLGAELPLPTRLLLSLTDFITTGWPLILAAVAAVWLVCHVVAGGKRGKSRRDRIAMRLPILGELFHLISIERFCRVLAALVNAGVPLPEAISVSADSTNNTIFITRLGVVRDVLIRGGGLSEPIAESDLFPVAARQMMRVGEQTGALGQQLTKSAKYYEREVGFKIKRATDLFEPTVILAVGLLVGFVAVAQVAAMYSIFGQVRG